MRGHDVTLRLSTDGFCAQERTGSDVVSCETSAEREGEEAAAGGEADVDARGGADGEEDLLRAEVVVRERAVGRAQARGQRRHAERVDRGQRELQRAARRGAATRRVLQGPRGLPAILRFGYFSIVQTHSRVYTRRLSRTLVEIIIRLERDASPKPVLVRKPVRNSKNRGAVVAHAASVAAPHASSPATKSSAPTGASARHLACMCVCVDRFVCFSPF